MHASAGHVDGDARRAPADRRLDLRAGARSAAAPSGSPTSPRGCGSLPASSAWPTRTPRCSCRCSTAATRWACWRRSIAARTGARSARTTSRCCARSPPAPRPPWRSRRACRPIGCAARWPPPTPSAAAGRASCTTRRCRAWAACGCCSPRRCASTISPRAQAAMREAVEHIEREIENLRAIITELRPAALDELGLRTAIEALLDRHREQSGFEIDGELALPGRRDRARTRLDEELETHRLPAGAGGAHERRQARPRRAACAWRCGAERRRAVDRGAGRRRRLRPRRRRARASAWPGCTSG